MSDNRRVYRTIRTALAQLHSPSPKGNLARHLNTLAALVTGIVQGKSCQLPTLARNAPDAAKPDSRIKRYSRWLCNERIDYEVYFLPFVQPLLVSLAQVRPLVFIIDGSEVGHGCVTLMISLVYQRRALPIVWLVVKGAKGHLAETVHLELLDHLKSICPVQAQAIFLGDGEFDGVQLQAAVQELNWKYVCRTAKNGLLYEEEQLFAFTDLAVRPGDCVSIPDVEFTAARYGPVTVIAWWRKGYKEPIYLVTNFELAQEACYWYRKRFQIETFFSDEKSRGFYLHKSHLSDPERIQRLMFGACLAYIWMVYLGITAHREGWVEIIHRTDRCDWSLFRLGLSLLEHLLNEDLPIPVAFDSLGAKSVR